MTREELIASLVTDKFSGFKDGDEEFLKAAGDARLEEFRTASEARKNETAAHVRLEGEHRQVAARLKVAEERIKESEKQMSEEDFMRIAPPSIKTLLEAHKAEEDAFRASMISQLKDLGMHTEEQLKARSTAELKELASYARIDVIVPNFSGKGVALEHGGLERRNYTPPNPYEKGIKALQEKQKVN